MDTVLVKAINKATGEVVELPTQTPEQIVDAWKFAQEYEKTAKALKDQLKKLVPTIVPDIGTSEPIKGHIFRVSSIQRYTYDKSVLRESLDADTYDLFLKPDKPAIDRYIKENVETLGELSTRLRKSMLPDGNAYQVIKLEKLDRS